MKPNGVLTDNMETDVEMDPGDLFSQLGFLVLEGRFPELSDKGRKDGPHCPAGPGELMPHTCDSDLTYECKRAKSVQRQMNMLWKNRIPMCIEVLLYQDCSHGYQARLGCDMGMTPNTGDGTCVLLERWLVQAQSCRGSENTVPMRVLFQAVRSYLHFSQLSAWLNLSKGREPANIGYRVSPPGEFCTSKFRSTPQWHTFPVSHASKHISIKVTLGTLPRLPCIPVPPCAHNAESSVVVKQPEPGKRLPALDEFALFENQDLTKTSFNMPHPSYSPQDPPKFMLVRTPGHPERYSPETTSPRFTKQRVKSLHELEGLCSKGECDQCRSPLTQVGRGRKSPDSPAMTFRSMSPSQKRSPSPQCSPKLAKGFSPQPSSEKDPSGSRYNPTLAESSMKDTGAIPKRPMHTFTASAPVKAQPDFSDHHALSAPEFEAIPDSSSQKEAKFSSSTTSSSENTALSLSSSPKVIITHKSPGSMCYMKDMPSAWAIRSISRESTDSGDNSSPELDRFLSKTLLGKKRLDPLSPQEMDQYLSNLCNVHKKNIDSVLSNKPVNKTFSESDYFMSKQSLTSLKASHNLHVKLPDCSQNGFKKAKDAIIPHGTIITKKNCLKLNFDEQESQSTGELPVNQARLVKGQQNVIEDILPTPSEISATVKTESVTITCVGNSNFVNLHDISSDCDQVNGHSQIANDDNKIKFTIGGDTEDVDESKSPKSPYSSKTTEHSNRIAQTEAQLDKLAVSEQQVHSAGSKPLLRKSVSYPRGNFPVCQNQNTGVKHATSLLRAVIKKEQVSIGNKQVPSEEEKSCFQQNYCKSANLIFHNTTGLPLQSSPAPIKRRTSNSFDYDTSLTDVRAIKNSISCVNLEDKASDNENNMEKTKRMYSSSAPASTNCLLGNFEESMLNGRIEPSGVVDGFSVDIGASGSFCPKHTTLPVTAFFFKLSDDNAPSPYLGHVNMDRLKRGYHVPKKGTVQVTLFNPNKTVVKMFVVVYDMTDMPANHQTFLRQRTLYMPVNAGLSDLPSAPVFLRYLIHLRFASSKSGKIYLHTDMRLIFARDKVEFDSRVANYELRSFTEGPTNPKFSPKR